MSQPKQPPLTERPLLTLVKREVRRLNGYAFVRAFARFIILPPRRDSAGRPTRTITLHMVSHDGGILALIRLAPDDGPKPKDVRDLRVADVLHEIFIDDDDLRVSAAVARIESVFRRPKVAVPPSRIEAAETRLGDLYAAVDAGEYALTRNPVKVVRSESGRLMGFVDPHAPCTGRRVRASKGGQGGLPIKVGRGSPASHIEKRTELSGDDLAALRESRAAEVAVAVPTPPAPPPPVADRKAAMAARIAARNAAELADFGIVA